MPNFLTIIKLISHPVT